MVAITDRRHQAIGGQSNDRKESAITKIAWHYTAVARARRAFITSHENYWRNTLGWRRGGYHYYIDADGKVYQNYNLTTISNGVGGNNSYAVHISVEANSANDYSQAQIDARHNLTLYLMDRLNLSASDVMQHKEFPGASTSCAGYTKVQMNAFRKKLANGQATVKAGWKKNNTGWWWQNADGSYPRNEWKKVKDIWYYFGKHGYIAIGWRKIGGEWYYFHTNGRMLTGWRKINGKWYYLNMSGVMQTGWRKSAGNWYYLGSDGAMRTGLIKVKGKHYFLQRNGVLITDEVIELEANKHGHLA